MAHLHRRRPQNVAGDLYVDSSCIDCDTCRWMAPEIFTRIAGQSAVQQQPQDAAARLRSLQALLSCPTASIGTVAPPADMRFAQASLPVPVTEQVYHCGYHSEKSYGAASYLIQRPEGNVLVDSPRFTPPLVKRIEALGGLRYLYLTHRDDVADHQAFQAHFGCDRILHRDDITRDTAGVEIQLEGLHPVSLAPDLQIIPVPGHTPGHTVLLFDQRVLFSGDHLAWSSRLGHLYGFRRHCWHSWPLLIESTRRLQRYSFEWVLPGHGHRYHSDRPTMAAQLQRGLTWMQTV